MFWAIPISPFILKKWFFHLFTIELYFFNSSDYTAFTCGHSVMCMGLTMNLFSHLLSRCTKFPSLQFQQRSLKPWNSHLKIAQDNTAVSIHFTAQECRGNSGWDADWEEAICWTYWEDGSHIWTGAEIAVPREAHPWTRLLRWGPDVSQTLHQLVRHTHTFHVPGLFVCCYWLKGWILLCWLYYFQH